MVMKPLEFSIYEIMALDEFLFFHKTFTPGLEVEDGTGGKIGDVLDGQGAPCTIQNTRL